MKVPLDKREWSGKRNTAFYLLLSVYATVIILGFLIDALIKR